VIDERSTNVRRTVFCMIVGILWLNAGPAGAQPPETQKAVAKSLEEEAKKRAAKEAEAEKLEQVLQQALKNNPDLRVAESKLHAAEAEMLRARLRVIKEVTEAYLNIESIKMTVKEAATRFETNKKLHDRGVLAVEELRTAEVTLAKIKAELASAQAKLPYLQGQQAPQKGEPVAKGNNSGATYYGNFSGYGHPGGVYGYPGGGNPAGGRSAANVAPAAPIANAALVEKLRTALDASIKVSIKGDIDQSELLEYLRANLVGVNLHVSSTLASKEKKLVVHLNEAIPMGALLQFLQDELDCVFVLRDYGIVAASSSERLPPGAVLVVDFWKQSKKTQEKTK
jgi:hypothetical protein